MAIEDLSTNDGWEAFKARHGGQVGEGQIDKTTDDQGRRLSSPFYKYIMKDGTTVSIDAKGNVNAMDEKSPSVATGTAAPASSNSAPTTKEVKQLQKDGSYITYTYQWNPKGGDDGKGGWELQTQIPPQATAAPAGASANKPPTDPSKWVPIHENPSDPTSKVIALQDPDNSSNRVTVPQGAAPSKPTVVQGQNGAMYSWDGETLKSLIAATPEKRQIVNGAGGALYSWDGTTLTPLQAGTYQPKNGDTMQDVVGGKFVTKTYQNGQWGVTNVGANADPTAAKEGDTRERIQNGYNTTETYKGGEWITTKIGDKAMPGQVTQVTAGADTPNIVTMQDGSISTADNPNYQPKTNAQIAARIAQLNGLAQAKSAEVQKKVGQVQPDGSKYTPANALDDYNAWYDKTIAPQNDAIKAAQDDAAFARAKDTASMRTSALQQAVSAQTQAQNAIKDYAAMHPVTDKAAYTDAYMKATGGRFGAPVFYDAPTPMEAGQNAYMQALKYIDPTAAQAMGAPPPDLNAIAASNPLNGTQYTPGITTADFRYGRDTAPGQAAQMVPANGLAPKSQFAPFGGQPPAMTLPGGAPPGGGAPAQGQTQGQPAPGSPDWVAMMARLNQDKAEQARQARFPGVNNIQQTPGTYNPYYQQGSAAGQPAQGQVAGSMEMPDWLKNGTPPPDGPTGPGGLPVDPWWSQYQFGG